MRTSKEMADAVLKARDAYEEDNRKRKKITSKTAGIAAVACSFCIMAGTLIYFNVNKPGVPDKSALEAPKITEVTSVSEDKPAETTKEKEAVTESKTEVIEENVPVTEAVSEITGTEPADGSTTVKAAEITEKPGAKESQSPSSDTGKKQDQAVSERKPSVTDAVKVSEKESVVEVTRATVTEKPVPRETEARLPENVGTPEKAGERVDEEVMVPESPKPSVATPKPVASLKPAPVVTESAAEKASVSPSPVPIKDSSADNSYSEERPVPVAAPASMKPSANEDETEILSSPSSEESPQTESAVSVTPPEIQAAFDEVINFTVVNNTDCYLYYKDDDQILVILCQTSEDVQMINDHISEKGYDAGRFECKINDIIIDLPAQKTDDLEKQCKQISRFMFQNDIYGYVKIDEFENENKIFVLLNDASSENVAKIRYFLSMYSINLNNVKIKNV